MPKEADNAEFDALALEVINSEKALKWGKVEPTENHALAIKRTRQVAFLKQLAALGTISHACKAAGINVRTESQWRTSNDSWYAAQFKEAMQEFRDLVEREVHVRAVDGIDEPIIGKVATAFGVAEDKIIGWKKKKSDLLLIFHAKRHIPEYRDKPPEVKDDKPMDTGSPMARITLRLDMMAKRQDAALPAGVTAAIDISPEQYQIAESSDGGQ